MSKVLGTRSKENLKGVHPNLVKVMTTAITNSPIDFTITEGVRTTQEQQALYAQGRSTKGMIVTTKDGVKNKSNHQAKTDGFGHAVDLYPYVDGKVNVLEKSTVSNLKKIAVHIKAVAKELGIGITWGGDWKSPYDPPHFELK